MPRLPSLASGILLAALVGSGALAGELRGRVAFPDPPAPFHPLTVTTQVHACGATPKPNKVLRVGPDGGLADCVVSLPDLPAREPQEERPILDQRRCEFTPHVLVVRAGEPFAIRNSDPVLHNVHALTQRGQYTRFNVGLPPDTGPQEQTLEKEEPVALRCDAGHRWMRGYIFPTRSAHVAKTEEDGTFHLEGVPPGAHEVRVWHPLMGEVTFRVTVPDAGAAEAHVGAALSPRPRLVAP